MKEGKVTTLSDKEIAVEIEAQKLIRNADPAMIEGACYQLRMGTVYYDLSEGGKRIALAQGQAVLIKPGHRVALITAEELAVPTDVLARVVSKGSLFSVGLSPVATYADPGFTGNMGIVTQNISDKYIELPQLEPLAKVDFTKLSSAASKPYQGQHGFQLGIWPIKAHLQKQHSEVADDPRVFSEKDEALALLPVATRTIIHRIERSQFWTDLGILAALCINAATLFFIGSKFMDNIYGIIGNLIATGLIAVSALYGKFRGRNT